MKEAEENIDDSVRSVISLFSCGRKNIVNKHTIWADVYVCTIAAPKLKIDTVLFLDINTGNNQVPENQLSIYIHQIENANRLKQCRIQIPKTWLNKIYRYKYRYAKIILYTDD